MGTCFNSVVVNAPADKVWAALSNFHDMTWAKGVVEKLDVVGDAAANQLGARRVINDAFHETLISLDQRARTFRYSIDDGPGPVAKDAVKNYVGSVRVAAITSNNTTFVEWASTYDSPNDGAVGELCNPVYQALLGALAKHFS